MLRRFVIRAWIHYECSTSIAKFAPVTTIFFLLNKICDGGSSKEPFLEAATLSILIWAYPRETKTNNGNFKNAAIFPSKVAYRWRACVLILPLCRKEGVSLRACGRLLSLVKVLRWGNVKPLSLGSDLFTSLFFSFFFFFFFFLRGEVVAKNTAQHYFFSGK